MLIHEMVHADTGDEHDERFFDKLVEIARTGEKWGVGGGAGISALLREDHDSPAAALQPGNEGRA